MSPHNTCFACTGTGHLPCRKCGGSGRREFNPWETPLVSRADCPACRGYGRETQPCPNCSGTGTVTETKTGPS
jgi:DnaJ-class molecular chaperone